MSRPGDNMDIQLAAADYVSVATTATNAQLLSTEQAKAFIDLALPYTSILGDIPAQNVKMLTKPALDISRFAMPTHSMVMGLADTAHVDETDYAVPVYSKRTLTPQTAEMHMAPTWQELQDNIEEEGLIDTIERNMAQAWANDLEYAALVSNTNGAAGSGIPTGLDTTIDGWRIKFVDGNVVDANGAVVSTATFENMILQLAAPVMDNPEGFKFYVSSKVYRLWKSILQARATGLGDMQLIDGNIPAYSGIPLKPVPWLPNAEDGVAGTSVSDTESSYTYILLARPQELFIGFHPEMRRWASWDYRDGKQLHIHLLAMFDVQISLPERTVLTYNVTPSIA